jgi:diguanylate cyclase (GGDEF)-like protein
MTGSLIASVADTTSHRDRDTLNHAVASLLVDFLDAESATIYRLVDDAGVARLAPRVAITRGHREQQTHADDDPSTFRALSDMPAWDECVRRHELAQYIQPDGNTCAVLPIESERDVIGLLVVESKSRLQARELELVGAILRILKNQLALLDYGERDTLTGMLNRKTFEATFEKLRQRLRATDSEVSAAEPSWIGLADIDKFKVINDSHGHLFGDEVLLLIAQLMTKCFRGADQLFRFGGEEFVIVLDHASAAGAQVAFDRLRATVEAYEFPQIGRVTISLGYSQITRQDGPTSCVERADSALYYAKNHGRNNVRNFETLVAEGELVARSEAEDDTELF